MDDESVITHISPIREDRQRRELDETETAMIARAGWALEGRKSWLRFETFDEVLAWSLIIQLIDDFESYRTCHTHMNASASTHLV